MIGADERMADLPAEVIAEAIAWRRDLHRHPELAYREQRTSEFVAARLQQFGLTVHRGLAGTGVVGTLTRGTGRRTIGIRADMDALPIQELGRPEHASIVPGVMHACGHDGHVAMALAAARLCARMQDLDGTVHFIFQPAEESEGGARLMIEDGLFRLFPCDSIYAFHNWPGIPVGSCVARDGAMMAALAAFEVHIVGRGCHGAMPHEGVDPISAACQLVNALQTIVSRNCDPLRAAVISVAEIRGGGTWNVIPDRCSIRGTTRWFDERTDDLLEQRMRDLSESLAAAFGCTAQLRYERRAAATINDPAAAALVRSVAGAPPVNLKVLDRDPSMASEDFAAMLQEVPGCYVWLGGGEQGTDRALHSPDFDFNDSSLAHGVALWVALIRKHLATA